MKIYREGSKVQSCKGTKVYPHFILEMTTLCKKLCDSAPDSYRDCAIKNTNQTKTLLLSALVAK